MTSEQFLLYVTEQNRKGWRHEPTERDRKKVDAVVERATREQLLAITDVLGL